jgi:CBS domain-containing protein
MALLGALSGVMLASTYDDQPQPPFSGPMSERTALPARGRAVQPGDCLRSPAAGRYPTLHGPASPRQPEVVAMRKLRDIMRPGFLHTVQQTDTVTVAVRAMTAHNVGILAVLDGDRLVGVFSERDVVRRVVDRGLDAATTPVGALMTRDLVVADADEDYQTAMHKMDRANIRHLPVVSGEHILSMLSIRDLMRVDIQDKGDELQYLREYLYQIPPSRPAS